jgi:argininosuccinate synthase
MAAILEKNRKLVRMLFHEGQFLDPVMSNIETFRRHSKNSKRNGNGIIETISHTLDGIESDNDLMNNEFGQYGEMNNAWTSDDAKGLSR